MDFSIRAANLDDCKDVARMIMVSGNEARGAGTPRLPPACVGLGTIAEGSRFGWTRVCAAATAQIWILTAIHGRIQRGAADRS